MALRKAYAIMDPKDYGRYLAIKYPELMLFVESHGMFLSQIELEKLTGTMLKQFFDSLGILIDYGVSLDIKRRGVRLISKHLLTIHCIERSWFYDKKDVKKVNKLYKNRKRK